MKKVIVTGGSGFVASWVIKEFLDNGYAVSTSLRSMKKSDMIKEELSHYVDDDKLANLNFFEADLTSPEGWGDAMKGSDGVIHVASPMGNGTQSVAELVNVAKNGALNILKAAHEAGVDRVVMTSSQAASTDKTGSTALLDESFWTDITNPDLDPYRISKVASEKAAWDYANKNNLKLTTILPGAIFGPAMSSKTVSSNGMLEQIMKGQPMLPRVPMEISDVRDLSNLHRLAFENDQAIGKRYLAASQELTMVQIAQIYQDAFPDLAVKARVAPNWLTKFVAKFVPSLRAVVPMLDRKTRHTTKAAETDLGWKQTAPETTVVDAGEALINLGLVE